jgi:glutathione synthase/RimK-type ligase-like ATP-grasp enzyme
MKTITKILKRLARLIRIVTIINWSRIWRAYNSRAVIIVWIPSGSLKYFGSDAFIWDMATLAGIQGEGMEFKIVYGKKIGKYYNKKIFFSLSNSYNIYGFDNYTSILHHITNQLELQGNHIYPKSSETIFWENKAYMHKAFDAAKVNEPKTVIYDNFDDFLASEMNFPFLIKAEHSCSSEGLYEISSWADIADLVSDEKFVRENKNIIVQELINMRKDLRVILVDNDIVFHYWRINLQEQWKPTSTSYGSKVDFDSFPEQWRWHIIKTFKSLNLTTGAFDITWENDDLNTEPIYLEVSPFYQPNPKMDCRNKAYAFYKQHFNVLNSWDRKYVDLVFNIKQKQVTAYLKEQISYSYISNHIN